MRARLKSHNSQNGVREERHLAGFEILGSNNKKRK
jgi:hypothetical protein